MNALHDSSTRERDVVLGGDEVGIATRAGADNAAAVTAAETAAGTNGAARRLDAVIVGAGLAGSTAALLLARAGWRVALVEKRPFPRRKVCGECVAASNLPLLHALGVGDEFERVAGAELRHVMLLRGADAVTADLPPARDTRFAWGRALGRETFDMLLLARARETGVEVWQPWTVRDIDGTPGAWRLNLRANDADASLRARVLIDAHGSWEPLRSAREPPTRRHRAGDLLAFKAKFRDASFPRHTIGVLALEGGYGGIVGGDGGITTLAGCVRRDRLDALRREAPGTRAGDVIERWFRDSCDGVSRALADASRDGSWLAAGPLAPGVRVGGDDGVFRIGNAAGEAHPILGEGMSMALQSAALLCRHLIANSPELVGPGSPAHAPACSSANGTANGLASIALQRRYAADWRREFTPRLRLAAAFAHTAMHPASGALMIAATRRWPGLLTQGARRGGKVRLAVDIASLSPPRLPSPTPPQPMREGS